MTLDLSPAAAAAPRRQRIAAHAAIETELTVRNGEQLLLALVIPVALLAGGLLAGGRVGLDPLTWPTAVLGLALWSTTFTSLAIITAFERRHGVLERLAATPLTRVDLLTGKALATLAIAVTQALLLVALALALGWRPVPQPAQALIVGVGALLAGFTFANLAVALAGVLRAEATLAVANLIYLAGAAAGLLVPASAYPAPWTTVVGLLPTGALGALLADWAAGRVDPLPVAVLLAWAALSLLLAKRTFQWTA